MKELIKELIDIQQREKDFEKNRKLTPDAILTISCIISALPIGYFLAIFNYASIFDFVMHLLGALVVFIPLFFFSVIIFMSFTEPKLQERKYFFSQIDYNQPYNYLLISALSYDYKDEKLTKYLKYNPPTEADMLEVLNSTNVSLSWKTKHLGNDFIEKNINKFILSDDFFDNLKDTPESTLLDFFLKFKNLTPTQLEKIKPLLGGDAYLIKSKPAMTECESVLQHIKHYG